MRRRLPKNTKIVIRKTQIRSSQLCHKCNSNIEKLSEVILVSNGRGQNRKYYHLKCAELEGIKNDRE